MKCHPDNTAAKFTTELSAAIELSGDWEVALTEITYPRKSFTVVDGSTSIEISETYYAEENITDGWECTVRLKEGRYETVEEVVNALNGEADGYFSVAYNGSKIIFFADGESEPTRSGQRQNFRLSPAMQRLLGFKKNRFTLELGDKLAGVMPPDFTEGLTSMYVYCDVIDPVVVGDCRVQLLRTLPFSHKPNVDVFNHVFSNPLYTPLQKKHFGTLEVNIMTDTGQPVPFVDGKSIVVLHFRRSSNPYFLLQK